MFTKNTFCKLIDLGGFNLQKPFFDFFFPLIKDQGMDLAMKIAK